MIEDDYEPTFHLRWAHRIVHTGDAVHHADVLQQRWQKFFMGTTFQEWRDVQREEEV